MHIRTKNKLGAKLKTRIVIILIISRKNVDQTDKWLIFVN